MILIGAEIGKIKMNKNEIYAEIFNGKDITCLYMGIIDQKYYVEMYMLNHGEEYIVANHQIIGDGIGSIDEISDIENNLHLLDYSVLRSKKIALNYINNITEELLNEQ